MADDNLALSSRESLTFAPVKNFSLPRIMSQVKATKSRPLGSLRHPVLHDSVPKFPAVRSSSMEKPITVQGNAMSVPPPTRVSPERDEKVSARSPTHRPITSKSDTTKAEESNDKKELREAMVFKPHLSCIIQIREAMVCKPHLLCIIQIQEAMVCSP